MDAGEISQYLARNVDSVVQYLLPEGKRQAREWVVGSIHGEAGDSLRVHLEGRKAGVWADFAGDGKGDLLDLWRLVRGKALPEAMAEIQEYFHLTAPTFHTPSRPEYAKPERPKAVVAKGKVLEYLTDQRKLTLDTIKAFQVAASAEDDAVVFPYKRDGELIMWKSEKLVRHGGKKQPITSKNTEACLFGWQALDPNIRTVVICEGEIDAMTMHQYGYPALSIPFGAGNHQWIDNEYQNLERFSEIYVCYDSDEAGIKNAPEVIARLGRHRCKLVNLYAKDVNECLQQGFAKEEIQAAFDNARTLDPIELKTPLSYLDEVVAEFYPPNNLRPGFGLPWLKDQIRFRPSEMTIWSGTNGHGKSEVLGHTMIEAVRAGERVCIASLEIKPRKLFRRLTRQVLALATPRIEEIKSALEWMDGSFWVFDYVGTAKTDYLLEVFRYARKRYGITQFVIDSLMKCGISEDDYKGQKGFVEALADFKNEYDCHVHLVAHSRKGSDESSSPRKMDIKGTGAITDIADNVLIVWRNKAKEEKVAAGQNTYEVMEEPDSVLVCDKQRDTGWEGKVCLWFDKQSLQFLKEVSATPVSVVRLGS